jgi:hypothetical protein
MEEVDQILNLQRFLQHLRSDPEILDSTEDCYQDCGRKDLCTDHDSRATFYLGKIFLKKRIFDVQLDPNVLWNFGVEKISVIDENHVHVE